jgi:hypothetical protein
MPIILALKRQRQEDGEFEDSWSCKARLCLKKTNKQTATKKLSKVYAAYEAEECVVQRG